MRMIFDDLSQKIAILNCCLQDFGKNDAVYNKSYGLFTKWRKYPLVHFLRLLRRMSTWVASRLVESIAQNTLYIFKAYRKFLLYWILYLEPRIIIKTTFER